MKFLKLLTIFLTAVFIFSSCQKELSFENSEPSSGTLKSDINTGDCLPSTVNGTYVVGTDLDNSNTIDVTIDVAIPGTYNITSDTINGYSFKGTGAVVNTGLNVVKLQGFGKPEAVNDNIFTIKYGSSACKILVKVVSSAFKEYFPLTQNSWWSYDINYNLFSDSLKLVAADNVFTAGNNYRRINFMDGDFVIGDNLYKKTGTEYYERIKENTYTDLLPYDQPMDTVYMFLNEVAQQGDSWSSDYVGTITVNNLVFNVITRYTCTMEEFNADHTVNNIQYHNVHKIKLVTSVSINNTPFSDRVIIERYFAKGIGLIHRRGQTLSNPNNISEDMIRNYKIF